RAARTASSTSACGIATESSWQCAAPVATSRRPTAKRPSTLSVTPPPRPKSSSKLSPPRTKRPRTKRPRTKRTKSNTGCPPLGRVRSHPFSAVAARDGPLRAATASKEAVVMKKALIGLIVLLVVGVAVAYWQGWFKIEKTQTDEGKPGLHVTLDKEKFTKDK